MPWNRGALSHARETLPEPYRDVALLEFDPHSMFNIENRDELKRLILTHRVATIVEIGCWLGASTRWMADLLPDDGRLYAVDHWMGSEEHQPGGSAWYPALPYLYQQFLSNIIHAGLTETVVPLRMSSLEAAARFGRADRPRIDLIYLDGSHDTASVDSDLRVWYPHVHRRGILCGDDWGFPTVRSAVQAFAREMNLRIRINHSFWRLED